MIRILAILAATAAGPAAADVFMFATPSGNIQCSVGVSAESADVQCSIVERSGPPPMPRPMACASGWGHSFILLERGPVQMVCGPEPTRLSLQDTAPYGETGRFGDITCQSERTGFSCRNADGHGFFLSRRSQRVF